MVFNFRSTPWHRHKKLQCTFLPPPQFLRASHVPPSSQRQFAQLSTEAIQDILPHSNCHPKQPKLTSLLQLGPVLFDPLRIPRYPIVLCHGLYGFSVRGPTSFPRFQIHYWGRLLQVLRKKLGIKVIVGHVPSTGSIKQRAQSLDEMLVSDRSLRNQDVNILAHSMGGLDARYLLSHIRPHQYHPISLTTVCTPHRGSPFMDWCRANIGVGSNHPDDDYFGTPAADLTTPPPTAPLPFSLKEPLLSPRTPHQSYLPNNLFKLLLNLIDSPAYSNLSTHFLQTRFNPQTPDNPTVKYFSVAGRTNQKINVIHPLYLPSLVLDQYTAQLSNSIPEEDRGHDGLVTVSSAKWGHFLGVVENTDHWEMRGSSGFGGGGGGEPSSSEMSDQQDHHQQQQSHHSAWISLNRLAKTWLARDGQHHHHDASFYQNVSKIRAMCDLDEEPHDSDYLSKSSLHLQPLVDWLTRRLPKIQQENSEEIKNPKGTFSYNYTTPSSTNTANTIDPGFPLNDLLLDFQNPSKRPQAKENNDHHNHHNNKFELESFYTALCRNLYDHGF